MSQNLTELKTYLEKFVEMRVTVTEPERTKKLSIILTNMDLTGFRF